MGALTKLTDDRVARVREALLAGAPMSVAAARAGVHADTVYAWKTRGDVALKAAEMDLESVPDADRPFSEFSETVTRARSDWELGRLAQIQQAGQGRPYRKTRTRTWDQVVTLKDENGKNVNQVVTMTDVTVEEGAEYDWRADAWLLERRNPTQYGRQTRLAVEGAITVQVTESLAEEADALVDELASRRVARGG